MAVGKSFERTSTSRLRYYSRFFVFNVVPISGPRQPHHQRLRPRGRPPAGHRQRLLLLRPAHLPRPHPEDPDRAKGAPGADEVRVLRPYPAISMIKIYV